ncbi:hypothetical protein RchiOBHm_Chr6g0246431 [Rosa chinensis]|uniref:Uncharacterized protein n=1 Tax=Rosa chinensis TaxID=74649 RepID=A0A2P6PJI9_ROSCH|nr:hypothetical protein RchiOBHm_Chr6g0246431 [Rosa chinensis]
MAAVVGGVHEPQGSENRLEADNLARFAVQDRDTNKTGHAPGVVTVSCLCAGLNVHLQAPVMPTSSGIELDLLYQFYPGPNQVLVRNFKDSEEVSCILVNEVQKDIKYLNGGRMVGGHFLWHLVLGSALGPLLFRQCCFGDGHPSPWEVDQGMGTPFRRGPACL